MTSIAISVIVCTRDRPDLLAQLLETLARQTPKPCRFEVLIVDNGNSDETSAVAERASRTFPELRYQREYRTGLSYARNSGWETARGEYVAFIDDDCQVPSHWVSVAQRTIKRHRPVIFGGPYYPLYDGGKRRWFKNSYGSREPDIETGKPPDFSGGNIVFRGDLMEKFGGFDPDLGMSGNRLAWGEETDLQRRIWEAMPNAQYSYEEDLYVFHLVRREKMTFRWLMPAWLAKGKYRLLASPEPQIRPSSAHLYLQLASISARILWDVTVKTLLRDRSRFAYPQNYWYEHTSYYLRSLGYAWAQWARRWNLV